MPENLIAPVSDCNRGDDAALVNVPPPGRCEFRSAQRFFVISLLNLRTSEIRDLQTSPVYREKTVVYGGAARKRGSTLSPFGF
jgi:hypothetical protein